MAPGKIRLSYDPRRPSRPRRAANITGSIHPLLFEAGCGVAIATAGRTSGQCYFRVPRFRAQAVAIRERLTCQHVAGAARSNSPTVQSPSNTETRAGFHRAPIQLVEYAGHMNPRQRLAPRGAVTVAARL